MNSTLNGPPDAQPGATWLAFFTPIHHFTSLADRKASFLLSATGLVLTVLFFFSEQLWGLAHHPHRFVSILAVCFLGALLLLLGITAGLAWKGFIVPTPPMPDTLAYFPRIAVRDRPEYFRQVAGAQWPDALQAILHYNYSVAQQAAAKFRLVNRAFVFFRWALVLWMTIVLMITVAS